MERAEITPIARLNAEQQQWIIQARITAKHNKRRFRTSRGHGRVFSFDLVDVDGGEIRATCFNDVLDQFYEQIEVGKTYLISQGSLRRAKKEHNHLKNDWEIFLQSNSTVAALSSEGSSAVSAFKLPVQERAGGQRPGRSCFSCGDLGHMTRNCPGRAGGQLRTGRSCFSCGKAGHIAKNCPGIAHSDGLCNLCTEIGHIAKSCSCGRFGNGCEFGL